MIKVEKKLSVRECINLLNGVKEQLRIERFRCLKRREGSFDYMMGDVERVIKRLEKEGGASSNGLRR